MFNGSKTIAIKEKKMFQDFEFSLYLEIPNITTTHSWYDGHFTSISACEVWGPKARVQIFRRELHTHIHLD